MARHSYRAVLHGIRYDVADWSAMKILLFCVVLGTAMAARESAAQTSPLDKAQTLTSNAALTLDGRWVNVDSGTAGIVRVTVSGIKVHAWGACHPKACDWGTVKGQPFASSVDKHDIAALLVSENPGFSKGIMTLTLEPDGRLRVQQFSHYSDGQRSDMSFIDYFEREAAKR